MFKSRHVDLNEATRLVKDRSSLPTNAANPLIAAMEEGSIVPECLRDGCWSAVDDRFFSTSTILWPHPYTSRSKRSDTEFYPSELRVLRSELDALWPDLESHRSSPPAPKGGRPPGDWDRAFIEATCFLLINGIPKTQAEFIAGVQSRLGDDAPGDTQMKERLGPLYKAAKAALG
ncbi:hypothetical protein [Methylobacterium radiotolerans]|uniref:hypothetical protein n=1 Tax=Methylobacterium radiotolerans TaxID=31998 RepID=UPI0015F5D4B7|nr:hypothetical protein [Methylobacterium radiotolerans]